MLQNLPPVLFLDFADSRTFCVPEDAAGLLIDRLAGKWAIKTSLRLDLDLRRPAGVVPHSSSTYEEFSLIPARPYFSANRCQNSLNPRHGALRRTIVMLISALDEFADTYTHLHGIHGFSEMVHVQDLKLCCRQRERVKPDGTSRSQLPVGRGIYCRLARTQLLTPRWTFYVFLILLTATFLNKPKKHTSEH